MTYRFNFHDGALEIVGEHATLKELLGDLAILGWTPPTKTANAVHEHAANFKPAPSSSVTPDKQEKARASTGKVKDEPEPTTPEAALASTLTYEKDLAPLFAKAVIHNKPAALATLGQYKTAPEVPALSWPTWAIELRGVLEGPSEADTPPALDYERDVVPKIKLAQAKDKTRLAEVLKAHGGVNPEDGKVSGRFVPAEKFGALVAALDAILA